MTIILYGNTPSKKNSQVIGRGGRRLFPNPLYGSWYRKNFGKKIGRLKDHVETYREQIKLIKRRPMFLEMYFFRRDKRRFDYINLAQSVQDALVQSKIIPDDNMTQIIPLFLGYKVDFNNPRCEVKIN